MGLLTKPIYASEALSAYVILDNELTEDLSAIRGGDLRKFEPGSSAGGSLREMSR